MKTCMQLTALLTFCFMTLGMTAVNAQNKLTVDDAECAGMSGFRGHWNSPISVSENAERKVVDKKVKDRGQTAVWSDKKPGAIGFDAIHRQLMVRFPDAAQKIAAELAKGKKIKKVELVLPFLDEEIWPAGRVDYTSPDGYRYRMNWNTDKYWRGTPRENTKKHKPNIVYREERPNWHALAHVLRKPWKADSKIGPTYNAAINGAVFWKRFGASDTKEDRFPKEFGPTEVSSYKPEGRMDVTDLLTKKEYGKDLGSRLRVLSDCGFLIRKWELYDHRYYNGPYEFTTSSGPRAIIIKKPKLEVTFSKGPAQKIQLPSVADVPAMATRHAEKPLGKPTAVIPSAEEVARLNKKFLEKPEWMPDWQYKRVQELIKLNADGDRVKPFYYQVLPGYLIQHSDSVKAENNKAKKEKRKVNQDVIDYELYLIWLDWVHHRPVRSWEGHLTANINATDWYNYREALPEPVKDSILRNWTAWLMPDRETAMVWNERCDYTNVSGKIIHPMADDPRVGKEGGTNKGKKAEWEQGDTYYKKTGDWRGNKSFYRSGFTRDGSTANFNSSASAGALLNGQIIGSEKAIADGRAGIQKFIFWTWTNMGVSQEYIDHYYWAIATASNKMIADHSQAAQDKILGWSIQNKFIEDLAAGYHPNLKKLIGPASRTYYEHVLGQQDGLYHILHVLSKNGALSDMETGKLPDLTDQTPNKHGRKPKPISAWGHDYPPEDVAMSSLNGPWMDLWQTELIDDKPLPWEATFRKGGDKGNIVSTWFGENYGLASIQKGWQRLNVLGHWRRKPERPRSMTDIGTLDMRIGFNQTQIGNDGSGTISGQGKYETYQNKNRLIMIARPVGKTIKAKAGKHKFGQKELPAQDIKTVQCSAALFSYEKPKPTWEIYIDDKKVEKLPATAKFGQVIVIRDGVSYIALRPIPTDDLGRDVEITLEEGKPQTQAYHTQTNIQPALLINAYFYKKNKAISKDTLKKLDKARSGFVVEMGDEKEYGSFSKFHQKVLKGRIKTKRDGEDLVVTYTSGNDIIKAREGKAFSSPEIKPGLDCKYYLRYYMNKVQKNGVATDMEPLVKSAMPWNTNKYVYKFTGMITPPSSGEYTFRVEAQGKIRFNVDGKPILDVKKPHWSGWHIGGGKSLPVTLKKGKPMHFVLDYAFGEDKNDKGKEPKLALYWTGPNGKEERVPAELFSHHPPASQMSINGKDPFADFTQRKLWRDTPLTQMGPKRLEKNGAVVESPGNTRFILQTYPKQNIYSVTHMFPYYDTFRFKEPGGISIQADGRCSLSRWVVKNSKEVDIKYHAFPVKLKEGAKPFRTASVLFISGAQKKPKVVLNDRNVTSELRPWTHSGVKGYLVKLGDKFPSDNEIKAGLNAEDALFVEK